MSVEHAKVKKEKNTHFWPIKSLMIHVDKAIILNIQYLIEDLQY